MTTHRCVFSSLCVCVYVCVSVCVCKSRNTNSKTDIKILKESRKERIYKLTIYKKLFLRYRSFPCLD